MMNPLSPLFRKILPFLLGVITGALGMLYSLGLLQALVQWIIMIGSLTLVLLVLSPLVYLTNPPAKRKKLKIIIVANARTS